MDKCLQAQIEADPALLEATEWFLELRSGNISSERIVQWERWLSEAAHRQAFDRVESLWHLTADVGVQWPSDTELTRDTYAGDQGIAAWQARTLSDGAKRSKRRWMQDLPQMSRVRQWSSVGVRAFTASLVVTAVLMGAVYWPAISVFLQGGTQISVHTGIGDSRTLTLHDGTVISVGGDTTLTVTLLEHSRKIALKSGEAYFRVKWNPSRPFTVRAGRDSVTDLGTIFDVRHIQNGIVVSVAEGVVRFATPAWSGASGAELKPTNRSNGLLTIPVTAGHRLALEPFDSVPLISSIDPRWVAAWRDGRLHYLGEPLGSVVADLERYSRRRIIVADPDVARLRVTAVVSVHHIGAWLASLSAAFPVRVVRQGDSEIIEPQQSRRHH